ncbi:ABSCISIC ACID-INSENSITIVE 5-like protein 6 [Corylus avellana]|uniref:ABSCISIC ACID-INSENSITIVE 5-like protein 6 n=1 Tax=Corylus avellana TaxID=13451 RepID=UPI001E217EDC|nr:ABSCISIC ACID-INSENSITIVE 5-like protein 6 [Corylus avellana]
MVYPNKAQDPQFPPLLARQGSLCNLTFDEAQTHLGNHVGKPLNNMLLDELLRNIICVEEGQYSSSSSSASFFLGNLNLNGTLSNKTVDEVWKDIVNEMDIQKSTLGETTLEEFLVRAGVVNPRPMMGIDPMAVVVSQQADSLQFQQITELDSNFVFCDQSVYENPVLDIGYSDNQLGMSVPMPAISSTSSGSQVAADRKRRCSDEMMEKTIDRRQKRMIKNRESAARSRARKQAYTNQLEHEVFHLRKTNSLLKKQKEMDILLSSNPTSMPRYQLRRTSSGSF